ncbi:erythromycin esterase family protein [Capnocytophaga canimorsus]|uniref:erythromycin esterase family protein n=1 Tax=Capnocytophaga canimorsus TaxID=28188 RepID=UPI0037D91D69
MPTVNKICFFVALFLSFFLLTFCQSKEKVYADYYNFEVLSLDSVNMRKNWSLLPHNLFDITQEKINGEEFFSIKPMKDNFWGIFLPVSAEISQSFIVKNPEIKNKVRVEISTKGKHIGASRLHLKGIDVLGNETFSDAFFLKDSNEWQILKHSAEIPQGTNEFLVVLEIKGGTTIQNQFFSLKKDVKIYLNENYLPNLLLEGVAYKDEYLQQAVSVPYNEIGKQLSEMIADKPAKVIAFGEPLHGSKEFPDVFFQFFQHQVTHNQVKKVFFEKRILEIMRWNRFITDQNSVFALDTLIRTERLGLLDPDFVKKILLWTKEYNKKNSDKIQFLGIDCYSTGFIRETDLGNFLYDINTPQRNPLLDTLFLKLDFSSKQKTLEVLNFMEANQMQLCQLLNQEEYEMIHQYIQNISEFSNDNLPVISREREMWMFQTAKRHINRLKPDERALVFSHWLHSNRLHLQAGKGAKTLGGHLLNEYGDDYIRIGGLAGEGTFMGRELNQNLKLGRANSPEGTLTHFLGKKKENNLVFSSMSAPEITMFPLYGAINTTITNNEVVRLSKVIDVGFFIGKVNAFIPSAQIKAYQLEELTQSILYRDRKESLLSQQKSN